MKLYSVTRVGTAYAEPTVWVRTQADAKALKKEWESDNPRIEVKVMRREVPTNCEDLIKWLNYHVTGAPRA